jgi:5'-methylthioadenosine/S-adenosylhomocysteine nucleosidase
MTPNIVMLAAMGSETAPLERMVRAVPGMTGVPIIGTGVGKVAAAATAARVIAEHRLASIALGRPTLDLLVFVGVAGAVAPELRRLDVVVGSTAVQWDVDLTAINDQPVGTLNDGRRELPLDAAASARLLQAAQGLGFRTYSGCIASGDAFVADQTKVAWLANQFGAVAVEMEGAAVAQVAADAGVPLAILRVISDGAGDEAALDFVTFLQQAAQRAAEVMARFLQS